MATRHHEHKYRLNVRFLGRLVLIVVVLSVGVYFLHRYQEKQLKDRYLTQADQARNDGKPLNELQYLSQYIGLTPTDNAARVRYGVALARSSQSPRAAYEAYFVLQKALQNDPEAKADVRLYCVRLAMRPDINQPNEARRDLEVLLKEEPDNFTYADLYADALIRVSDTAAAEAFLTQMVNRNKNYIDGYARLAHLKREKTKSDAAADIVFQDMLRLPANAADHKAWLRIANYRRLHKQYKACDEALAKARELAPNDSEVLYTIGDVKLDRWRQSLPPGVAPKITPDFTEGVALFEKAIENLGTVPPTDPFPEFATKDYYKLDLAAGLYRGIAQAYTTAERFPLAEKYARAQVARFPNYLPLQLELLDVLVRTKQYAEASAICSKMENAGFAPAIVELQRGFIAAGQDRWIDASRSLERTLAELAPYPDLVRRANLMLAMCYERTGEHHRVYETLRKAVPTNRLDPTWAGTKMSLAATMARLGLNQNAIREYKDVVDSAANSDPRAIEPLLALLTVERSRQPNPAAIDAEIQHYLSKVSSGPGNEILQANLKRSKNDAAGAREQLLKAIEKYPDALSVYLALFEGDLRDRKFSEAETDIAKTEAKFGATYNVARMKLSLIATKAAGDAAVAPELEKLVASLDDGKYSKSEKINLLKMLSYAARSVGRLDLASNWLDRVAKEQGDNDIDTHYQRFDLAVLGNDDAAVTKVLSDIARIAGGTENPTYRLAFAFSLIYKADRVKDNAEERTLLLERANEALGRLEQSRKDWARLSLAQAKVADMLQKRDVAMNKYRLAIEQGERGPEVFRRLADLYYLNRDNEAISQLVATYPEASLYLSGQNRKLVTALINSGDTTKALELARKTVAENTTDANELFWLGQVLLACHQAKEAETILQRAQGMAPENCDLWLVYIKTLVDNDKKSEALQFLEKTQSKLKQEESALALAQAWTLLNDPQKSLEIYKKLLEQKPDDISVLRAAGGFAFAIRDYTLARKLMEKILNHPLKKPTDTDIARRTLAYCIIANQNHNDAVRALDLLGFKTADAATEFTGKETIDDLRCRFAVLSAIKGRAARMATVAVLRQIEIKSKTLSTDQQLAFARIQFALGDWIESKRRFEIACAASDGGALAQAMFAGALLRKGDLNEAKKHIDRVVALEPNTQQTAELVARHAVLSKKNHEAVEAIRKYSNTKDARPEIAAMMLEQLGLPTDAEAYYRRAAENTAQPAMRLLYGGYLARQGRASDALAEFEKVWSTVEPAVYVPMLCESALHINPSTSPAVIQKIVDRVEAETKKNDALKPYLAALYSIINRVPEGIATSYEVLAKDKNNVFTLNNLAFMIALKDGKHDEGITLIRSAIGVAGPLPTLLDTEATILIAAGRANDAIEKLREVIVDEPSASAYLHLAQAYFVANRMAEAELALADAKKHNLHLPDFHPLERQALSSVIATLEKK